MSDLNDLKDVFAALSKIEDENDAFVSGLAKGMLSVAKMVMSILDNKTLGETGRMGRLEMARVVAQACEEVAKEINDACDEVEEER